MPRSAGINNYTIMHAGNVSLTLIGMLFSYTFNKVYLNKHHNHRFDRAERNLNQNLIDFKKLIAAILLGGGLILSLLYLQLNYKDDTPVSAIFIASILTLINFRHSSNPRVTAFIKRYLVSREVFPHSVLHFLFKKTAVVVPTAGRNNIISAATAGEANDRNEQVADNTFKIEMDELSSGQTISPTTAESLTGVTDAVKSVSRIGLVEPRVAPLALQTRVVPSALQPRLVPSALQPRVVPSAIQPSVVPSALQPRIVPSALQQRVVPSFVLPRVVPSAIQPGVVPSALQPRVLPSALQLRVVLSALQLDKGVSTPALQSGKGVSTPALQSGKGISTAALQPVSELDFSMNESKFPTLKDFNPEGEFNVRLIYVVPAPSQPILSLNILKK